MKIRKHPSSRRLAAATLLGLMTAAAANAGVTTRVSTDLDGVSQLRENSGSPATFGTGSMIAFVSADANGVHNVYVHERGMRTTSRASIHADSYGSHSPSIGMALVAYVHDPSDGQPDDGFYGWSDIYVRDMVQGETKLVTVDLPGRERDGHSYQPAISKDGRVVAFHSGASSFTDGGTVGANQVFARSLDSSTNAIESVSVDNAGVPGNDGSYGAAISGTGRYVAFRSLASNLVPGDTNGVEDVFVRDRVAGTTTRVSVTDRGGQAIGGGTTIYPYAPAISFDGRYVVFDSRAELVSGVSGAVGHVYLHDRQTGVTSLLSKNSAGTPGAAASFAPAISGDGRYVSFMSSASNLVSGDTNGVADVFVHDRQTGATTRASVATDGTQGNAGSTLSAIADNGRYIAFESAATALIAGDTNNKNDVFVHDRLSNIPEGPLGAETCADGVDNDLDGTVDGQDSGCSATTPGPEGPFGALSCSDGLDNDVDGLVDGNDPGCIPPPPPPTCEGVTATIVGTAGNDVINGSAGADVIVGLGGDDVIYGNGGDDRICGDVGNDTLDGGTGADRMYGGDNDDTLYGRDGSDRLYGDANNDRIYGGSNSDVMRGGTGTDYCDGGSAWDFDVNGCESMTSVP